MRLDENEANAGMIVRVFATEAVPMIAEAFFDTPGLPDVERTISRLKDVNPIRS